MPFSAVESNQKYFPQFKLDNVASNFNMEDGPCDQINSLIQKQKALNEYFIEMTRMCRRPVSDCQNGCYKVFWLSELENLLENFLQDIDDETWFSVKKPVMPAEPRYPDICKEWVDDGDETKLRTQLIRNAGTLGAADVEISAAGNGEVESTGPGNGNGENAEDGQIFDQNDVVLYLNDYPEVQRQWESYLAKREKWYFEEYLPWERRDEIYQKLRGFAKKIEENRESYEVVLALGLVIWKKKMPAKQGENRWKKIYHHAITIPCNIRFDVESGQLTIGMGEDGAKLTLDLDFCDGDFGKNLEKVSEILSRAENNPWSEEVKKAIEALSNVLNGHYIDNMNGAMYRAADRPWVVYAPALYLRPHGMEAFLHFAGAVRGILQSDGLPINGIISKILGNKAAQKCGSSEAEKSHSSNDCGEALLPLPANAEQRKIVEILKKHNLVLVQGPPGTGKTGTIANLICHLLSNGERVLVTAHMDRALRPLREKLPIEIANLCVTQIGDNPNERREILKESVNKICERQVEHNPQMAQSAIESGWQRLHLCRCDLEKLKKRLARIQEGDCKNLEIIGKYRGQPSEIAKLVNFDRSNYGWFADEFDPQTTNADQVHYLHSWFCRRNFRETILSLGGDSEIKILSEFPKADLEKALEDLATHRKSLCKMLNSLPNWAKELFTAPDFPNENYFTLCRKTCDVLTLLREEIVQPASCVHFAPRRDLAQVENDLKTLINYYENHSRWERLWKRNEVKSYKYLTRNLVFYGKPVSDSQAAHRALDEVEALRNEWAEYEKKIAERNTLVEELIKSWLPLWKLHWLPEECTVEEIEKANENLQLVLKKEDIVRSLQSLFPFPITCNFCDHDAIDESCKKLELALQLCELHQLEETAKSIFPKTFEAIKNNPELYDDLDRAFEWKYAQRYMAAYFEETDTEVIQREIERLRREEISIVRELASSLAWKFCLDRLSNETSRDLRIFSKIKIPKGGKQLMEKRAEAAKYLERCTRAIPAWIMPIDRVWSSIKPGPSPIFDVVIVDEASQCGVQTLLLCYLAKKIIIVGDDKQITPTFPFKDVGLANTKRNKYLIGFDRPEIFDFTEKSLYGIADVICDNCARLMLKEHFRCMPKIIGFSNKHFYGEKLIPMKRFKSHELPPLEHRYIEGGFQEGEGEDIHNCLEAEEIALKIAECMEDERYFDENGSPKSIGVIVLQGYGQVECIEKALARLEIDEKKFFQCSFRIGDAREFQGDERDIIFLSMVVGGAERRFQPLTKEEFRQKYNVAMSRAKEQVWLFHSIMLDEVPSSKCMRHELLKYFYDARERSSRQNNQKFFISSELQKEIIGSSRGLGTQPKPFDSWFEADVADALARKGYAVIPQLQVSRYRIDLVVEGHDGRQIPIECDGDFWYDEDRWKKDQLRQEILERCGWGPFIRIRECKFRDNPEAEIAHVIRILDDNKILPSL